MSARERDAVMSRIAAMGGFDTHLTNNAYFLINLAFCLDDYSFMCKFAMLISKICDADSLFTPYSYQHEETLHHALGRSDTPYGICRREDSALSVNILSG